MPRISDRRRAERREQLVRAAVRCVIRSGFQGLTMAEVIAESGLSAGAVYGYFTGKNQLLGAVADRELGAVRSMIEDFVEAEPLAGPAEVIEALVGELRRLTVTPDGDLTIVIVQVWGQAVLGGEIHDVIAPQIRVLTDRLTTLAGRWQASGTVGSGTDPAHVARVLLALLPGYLLQRHVIGDLSAADYANGLRALITR